MLDSIKNQSVLILGGGFAGARAANDLVKAGFTNVLLVDRKDYFEVTYATLRGLVDLSLSDRARIRYRDVLKCKFQQAEITELDLTEATLSDGSLLPFDWAIIATGSSYTSFSVGKSCDALTLEERKKEFADEHTRLKSAENILIVGGGPVGVELAGEIAEHYPQKNVTLVDVKPRILGDLSAKASKVARRHLKTIGVNVITGQQIMPDDDVYKQADIVYKCYGVTPNTSFMRPKLSQYLDHDGRIKVDAYFRMKDEANIFAIGDCATMPAVKFGYVADAQGKLTARNFASMASGKRMKPFKPPPVISLVPVGPTRGLMQLPFVVTTLRFMLSAKQNDMFITKQFENLGAKSE